MKLSTSIYRGEGGRALLILPDIRPILLSCSYSDIHPMGKIRKWILRNPLGNVWTDGVFINEERLDELNAYQIIRLFFHEVEGHWWQCWKRMGPRDYKATYGWLGILKRRAATHPMEIESDWVESRMSIDYYRELPSPDLPPYNVMLWHLDHFPATR